MMTNQQKAALREKQQRKPNNILFNKINMMTTSFNLKRPSSYLVDFSENV